MHSNNDKKDSSGSGFIPSDRFEKYTGPNKEIRDQYAKWQRESNKPGSQMESSSSTSAGSSKGKSK
ncbi:hypothetical protein [Wolbachia endosymbiont (group A) of Agelastica alni]|uniref:hypothetical protein n=1 Tax=Wolbachia endosymbiont (group A) of Agelastica alni TaxID=3066130 RepID=UPI003132CA99